MFDWFKKKPRALEPENKWVLAIDSCRISVTDHAGQFSSITKDDLSGVIVETTDSGPWGADVWWLLFDRSDKLACAYPQGAAGETAVLDYLTKLPSFDHGEMIKAMTSTDNAVFAVWQKAS